MMKRSGFWTGFLTCLLLIGAATTAYAAGITATRSTNRFVLDGQEITLDAYGINEANYLKLRDVAELVDFNVYWDPETGFVHIETDKPYTGVKPEDTAAVPADDIVNSALAGLAGQERMEVTTAMGCWPCYEVKTAADGTLFLAERYPEAYKDAAAHCQPFIDSLADLSDREKVRQIAFYAADHLIYDASRTPTPRTVLSSDGVQPGNCTSYAFCVQFLCQMAGIPCVRAYSESHMWTQVWVEGQWWNVDATGLSGVEPDVRDLFAVLFSEEERAGYGSAYQIKNETLLDLSRQLTLELAK